MKIRTNAERVRQLREAKGWTQQQLADKASMSDRTIQRIEKGDGARRDYVGAVAAALDVPVEEFLAPAGDETAPSDIPEGAWPVKLNRVTSGKKLLDLLLWSSRLEFAHDLDPGYPLSDTMTSFIDKCGEVSMDNIHLEQIDTSFAVETAIQEIDRLGSLNHFLSSLESSDVYVYAGAYTRRGAISLPPSALPDRLVKFIETVVLIQMLGRDVPSVTVHVDRKSSDELLDRETSDKELVA